MSPEILLEVTPSAKSRNSHLGLGITSASFASILLIINLVSLINHWIGLWTALALLLPMLLFAAVAWFVLRFGGDYVMGIRILPEAMECFFPTKKAAESQSKTVLYKEIQRIQVEEALEVHRTGRRIRRINVYRVRIQKEGDEKPVDFAEMLDLPPEQILKFRQIPAVLLKHGLIEEEKVDYSNLP